MDLCQEDSSEEQPEQASSYSCAPGGSWLRLDGCDSEDLDSGFVRYRERNLADWLGLRMSWPGWKLQAISTMTAYQVDFFSWVSGRRKWGDERRGPGRTKDRRREQLERERPRAGTSNQWSLQRSYRRGDVEGTPQVR